MKYYKTVFLSLALLLTHPAVAGILFDTVRDTRARNGIIVLVQPEDAVCTDAARLNFTVLALDTRPERVAALRRQFQEQDVYGRVSVVRFDGKTIPCVDGLVNAVVSEATTVDDAEHQHLMGVIKSAGLKMTFEPDSSVN